MATDKRNRKMPGVRSIVIWTPDILHGAMAGRDAPIQRLAQKFQRSPHTVKRWWQGRNEPKASDLMQMIAEDDSVFERVMKMTGRDIETETQKAALKKALAILEGEG